MFSLHRDDELAFDHIPSCQQHKIRKDISIMDDQTSVEDNNGAMATRKRSRKLVAIGDDQYNDSPPNPNPNDNINHKKVMHRNIERLRRQESAKLYASLRSLLPFQYIKGRRSVADHMHQAVNYIKDLQEKIKELDMKRDKLKQLSDTNTSSVVELGNGSSSNNCLPTTTVTVNTCGCGVEILISSGLILEVYFPLSRVLELVIEEGLGVVSCVSTKINARLLYTIQSEVSDLPSIDLSVLQQKLTDVINTQLNFKDVIHVPYD